MRRQKEETYHPIDDDRRKIQLKAELEPPKVKKKSNPKQFDGIKSDKPFVKTRKKVVKKEDRPEQTAFDKWFN